MGEGFAEWIGRQEQAAADVVSARLLAGFRATLGAFAAPVEVPPGVHWCLSPPIQPPAALGPDGHPAKGGFLPPVPLPRRMWAGGDLEFLDPLQPGDNVARLSTLESIRQKEGRSGPLCFVSVRHDLSTPRGLALREIHHIVFRPAATAPAAPAPPLHPRPAFAAEWQVPVDPVLLFRYSALTFNGHRIHYDQPYAIGIEFYPGLVIHGPLMATLMLNLATVNAGRLPRRFAFRALSPACGAQRLTIGLIRCPDGADLSVLTESGALAMQGRVDWA